MTDHEALLALPDELEPYFEDAGHGRIVRRQTLTGGLISTTERVTTSAGGTFVVKRSDALPDDVYRREAEGLSTLAGAGVRVPAVVELGRGWIVLEDLGDPEGDGPVREFDWIDLGHRVARMHLVHGERHGFATDNYIGLLPQPNPWTDDGHEFYLRHRIVPYLEHPTLRRNTPSELIDAIERVAGRIRDLVPSQPASLLHGDLWVIPQDSKLAGNIMADRSGVPTLLDPAVYYGWAEADLGMTHLWGPDIPRSFWDAYLEVNPLERGWEDRLRFFYLHDHLAVLAAFGDNTAFRDYVLAQLRTTLAHFA